MNAPGQGATEKSFNRTAGPPRSAAAVGGGGGGRDEGLGDDFIVDDEADAEGEYADED